MTTLTRAHKELFRRNPDERFPSLSALWEHCHDEKKDALTRWHPPGEVFMEPDNGSLTFTANAEPFEMTDWSFSQLCKLASVGKDTVNKLTARTAAQVFHETLPRSDKPLQVYTLGHEMRSIHGTAYTRLYNADVLSVALEFTTDFQAPQEALDGGTGLYCGEQDMFAFLIDPLGWTDIDGEAFAPGYFLWNSEVGKRTVGVQTFWFQAVCRNHIIWDAIEVTDFSRRHTANVHDALDNIRCILEGLTAQRDQRRDKFVQVVRKAMRERLGTEDDEAIKLLGQHGIGRALAQEALATARTHGELTIFAVVDALTRLSQRSPFAGDRAQADARAGQVLQMAA